MVTKSKARFLAAICCLTLTLGSPVYAQEVETPSDEAQIVSEGVETSEESADLIQDVVEETVDVAEVTEILVNEEPTEPTEPIEPVVPTERGWFNGVYYVASNGTFVPANGAYKIDGQYCYLKNGKIRTNVTGIVKVKTKYYYFKNGVGTKPSDNGLIKVDGHYYCITKTGYPSTGLKLIDGVYYYFDTSGQGVRPEGATSNGIKLINGVNYKFTTSGKAYTKTGLILYSGHYYYFGTSGKACTSYKKVDDIYYQFDSTGVGKKGWLTVGSYKLYTSSTGKAYKGWVKIDGYYYYFSSTKRYMQKSKVVDGYKLDKNGKNKTRVYIKDTVKKYTTDSMSRDQKINALWSFMMSSSYRYVTNNNHLYSSWTWADGWTSDYARDYFVNKGGNCFGYAATFGYLVKEATGLPVRVYHGTTPAARGGTCPHGWCTVKINGVWYTFDPDLYKYTAKSSLYYYTAYSVTKKSVHFGQGYNTL